MPNAVYDEEEKLQKKAGSHDDLGMSDADRDRETSDLNDSFYRDEGPDLLAAEQSGDTGNQSSTADASEAKQVNGLYRTEGESSIKRKVRGLVSTRKRKLILGGGVGGGLAGLAVFGSFLVPLKILHIANNLQDNFFAASEQAGEDITEHLFRSYIVNKVMPGMINGKCSSTKVSRSCAVVSTTTGPIGVLYQAWKDNNLEGKLATKYGIEIQRNGNKFTLITPSTGANGIDLGNLDGNPDEMSDRMSRTFERRADIRREFRTAFEANTFSKRIMYRFKVGPLLERKYGIKRCLIACNTRDRFSDSKDRKKLAFKSYFVEKIVQPRNEMYGLAMRCALSGFSCTNPPDYDENGESRTEFETELRESVNRYAASGKSLEELDSLVQDFNQKGFGRKIIENLLGEFTAKVGASSIPVIGWINLGATIFSAGSRAGPALATMNYAAMASTGVTAYQMFIRTPADEIKSGQIDATVLGSLTNSLGPNAGKDQGGLGAEGSPYYNELMGNGKSKNVSFFNSNKVYAAGSGYLCNDGKPLENGEIICPEEKYTTSQGISNVAGSISAVINGPLGIFADSANLWVDSVNKLVDWLLNPIADLLAPITGPLLDKFMSLISGFTEAFIKWFAEFAFNQPITDSTSGARWFNVIANGADEAGNSFAHYGMGASAVDYATAQSIRTARADERLQEFKSQSLLARVTDTNSPYSVSSKFAMSVSGGSVSSATQSLASSLMNPLGLLSSSFDSLIPSRIASAARNESPAGITQYAWDPNDPVFTTDPEQYIKNNDCENPEQVKNWNKTYSRPNPKTNMPELTKANGCLLLNTGISMGGAYFTDELLTAEELGDSGEDVGVLPNSGAGTEFVMGTYNQPARGNASAAASRILGSKMDVVGLQEQSGTNYNVMRGILKGQGYGVFPDVNINGGGHCARARSIYFNKSKFSLSKSEIFDIPSYEATADGPAPKYINPVDCGGGERTKGGGRANVPIVWLSDTKTSQTIIVINTHNLANCCGGGGEAAAKKRYEAAQIYIAKIKELNTENPGIPIFFSGDFNEGTGVRSQKGTNTTWQRDHNNLFYCMVTKQERIMIRAAGSRDQPCQTDNESIGDVDYIYASPGVQVEWVNEFRDPSTNDSPHNAVFAKLVVPGSPDASGGSEGWSWPLKNNINNGPCYGGPRVHAGMDMNSATADNPVYAMHSGKVVRRGSGGAAGNYITILADTKFGGSPVYYSYEHLRDGSIKVNAGDQVTGGQEVAIAGLTGNVDVSSSKAHLHIVTATTNSLGSYGNLGTTFDPMRILRTVNPVPGGYKCYAG